ncbi:MAG: hypothetical protein LBU22_10020 [Dysgonamonadaceae bacterium]|jgi:hypothetical protein|nr:hypothetical protein [Dysgonamonadaceae bacterium]
MRKLFSTVLLSLAFFTLASAGNYNGFKVSVYTKAYTTMRMSDIHWLDSTWNIISSQIKVDKIYLETHRDMKIVPDETLEQAKKFFLSKGVEVAGGITYTISEMNNFETFCYSNPEHRKFVKEVAEHTAKHFDEFILDDFFFTSCKSDIEIKAKGTKSWTQYRNELMTEAGRELVINPAKKVNPKVKVIIKYPNWYDHFQGLGFNLETGPQIFDGVWTGTETRDPSGSQHLQNYQSYGIIRYFHNLRPGHNFGGWIDSGGAGMGMDRYAEQFWLTFFAKAPEIALCAYDELIGVRLNPEQHRTAWQGQSTSFDYDEMAKPVNLNGKLASPTTIARVAGYTAEKINAFISKLGNPVGVKTYKPHHSEGDDFLPNYLGMAGIPMDITPEFPTDQKIVLLTEQAKYDPALLTKIKAQLNKGGDVVITTNLLKAIPEKIAEICELRVPTDVLVNEFGAGYGAAQKAGKDILVPMVMYHTNDAWETVSAGRPLTGGVTGYPVILRAQYSKGNLYVITIPNDFGNLYDYPESVLNQFRQLLSKDIDVRIEAPVKVSLFAYDNGTFIVESFRDEPVTIKIITGRDVEKLTDLVANTVYEKLPSPRPAFAFPAGMELPEGFDMSAFIPGGNTSSFRVTIPPHSYKVFKK